MAMPFSPCDTAANCDDKSVAVLTEIFGDVVTKLVGNQPVGDVSSGANVIASMLQAFNSGVLVLGGLLLFYITVTGMANTANDGEAMGQKWSTMWTPIRMVYGAGMLLPTSSGFSIVQLIVLMFALWGAGLANLVYKAGVGTAIFSPNAVVKDVHKAGAFYGGRQFAMNYAQSVYCQKLISAAYANSPASKPDVRIGTVPDKINQLGNGVVEQVFYFKDRNPQSNLLGGQPVCGAVKLTTYQLTNSKDSVDRSLNYVDVVITTKKNERIATLRKDIEAWVQEWPTDIVKADWGKIRSARFTEIVNRYENGVADDLRQAAEQSDSVKNAMNEFMARQTSQGWMMAGGWSQRVGMSRSALGRSFSRPVAVAEIPSPVISTFSEELKNVSLVLGQIRNGLVRNIEAAEAAAPKVATPPKFDEVTNYFPSGISNVEKIKDMSPSLSDWVNKSANWVMQTTVESFVGADSTGQNSVMCGTSGEMGGSMNRIKCVGDYLANATALLTSVKWAIISAEKTLNAVLSIVGAAPHPGEWIMASTTIHHIVNDLLIEPLSEILMYTKIMAFYFSVFLTSLPYVALIVASVGWIISIIQAMLMAQIGMLKHMMPSNNHTFIGADHQMYLTFMAVFIRPVLAIIGLFAAFIIADPVIDYVTLAFFESREALMRGGGVNSALSNFITSAWWIGAYGLLLLPILYMIFFFPQSLPDKLLSFLGWGLNSLGDSTAVTDFQTSMGKSRAGSGKSDGSLGILGGRNRRDGENEDSNARKRRGNSQSMTNGQGVTPRDTPRKDDF